jgi:hypothetical protein
MTFNAIFFCFIHECGSWYCKRSGVGMKAPWLSTFLIGLAMSIFVTSTFASPVDPASVNVQDLTFTKLLCPAGCSKLMKSSLQPFIGSKVQIGPSQFTGAVLDSLFDHCDGKIELRPQQQSRQEQLLELKKTIAPNHKFDTASLRLPEAVLSALVVCNREMDRKAGNIARIISIEDGRVLVLFEYLSVLDLRKK